ncbi:MAG: hypothetical protein KGJ30_07025, partial [Burkholderiales bacterium]|nr:hypothetical protein [Burkholderiales bacterium]
PQETRFWYELLGSSHVAFAICSANGRVLAAIDLDYERQSSRRSIQIKQSVLAACRVRYLRCAPDQLPSIPELQLMVPSSGAAARGAQPAPTAGATRETLTGSAGGKRRERRTLWQDSGFMQDSFFGTDGRSDIGIASGFGTLRPAMTQPPRLDESGGVVVDTPASRMRH